MLLLKFVADPDFATAPDCELEPKLALAPESEPAPEPEPSRGNFARPLLSATNLLTARLFAESAWLVRLIARLRMNDVGLSAQNLLAPINGLVHLSQSGAVPVL